MTDSSYPAYNQHLNSAELESLIYADKSTLEWGVYANRSWQIQEWAATHHIEGGKLLRAQNFLTDWGVMWDATKQRVVPWTGPK